MGTACIGTSGPPNGLGTRRLGNTARFETRPQGRTTSIAFPPASATTKRQRSKRTSTGLESTAGLPTAASGLTSRSNAQRSAILRIFPGRGISSSRPKRSATGFSAASASREIVAPIGSLGSVGPPLVTKTWSLPSTVMPCGPIALSLFGVFAYEARPNPRLAPPATDLGHCPRGAHARGTLTTDEARPALAAAGLRHEQVTAGSERQVARAVEPGRHDVDPGGRRTC